MIGGGAIRTVDGGIRREWVLCILRVKFLNQVICTLRNSVASQVITFAPQEFAQLVFVISAATTIIQIVQTVAIENLHLIPE